MLLYSESYLKDGVLLDSAGVPEGERFWVNIKSASPAGRAEICMLPLTLSLPKTPLIASPARNDNPRPDHLQPHQIAPCRWRIAPVLIAPAVLEQAVGVGAPAASGVGDDVVEGGIEGVALVLGLVDGGRRSRAGGRLGEAEAAAMVVAAAGVLVHGRGASGGGADDDDAGLGRGDAKHGQGPLTFGERARATLHR